MVHVLAVSGLHVGFLIIALSLIISKIKVKRWLKTAILSSILLIYCYFCSFSPSVVRASIMFFILSLAILFGKKYDQLNALSIAGLIIILIRPLSVFDAGFQLSFACVMCILMFYQTFISLFSKYYLPTFIAKPLAVSIPVTFGILPIMCQYFTQISILGVFANLIVVPIFEVFFILLFIAMLIGILLPFLSFILKVPMLLIHVIIFIASFVSSVKFVILNLSPISSIFIVGIYCSLFIVSHFINFSNKSKTIICATILVITCSLSGIMALPVKIGSNRISVVNSYDNNVYAIELGGKEFVVGRFDKYTIEASSQFLLSTKTYVADYYVSLTNTTPAGKSRYKNIYTCSYAEDSTLLVMGEEYDFDGIKCSAINLYGNFVGILLEYQDTKVFICNNKTLNEGLCMDFASQYGEINILIGNEKYTSQLAKYLNCIELYNGKTIRMGNKVLANCQGNWTFELKDDIIFNVRSLD